MSRYQELLWQVNVPIVLGAVLLFDKNYCNLIKDGIYQEISL
jgi:hypothetical protein